VEFEFDPKKSQTNKAKHGINFQEAQGLWNDQAGIEIQLPPFKNEQRYARIAKIAESQPEIWTAIFTLRSEKIRLVSVRRAREKEKETYG
jgi:uncharacterized DUF497 family protein